MVRLEADPSLYATPWFLTIFAAHFPLGFVSRVLDLVFLEGTAAALVKVIIIIELLMMRMVTDILILIRRLPCACCRRLAPRFSRPITWRS